MAKEERSISVSRAAFAFCNITGQIMPLASSAQFVHTSLVWSSSVFVVD